MALVNQAITPQRLDQAREIQRILMLVPHLKMGGADKFNLDLLTYLAPKGYKFFVCLTDARQNPWLPRFQPLAEEILVLADNIPLSEQPQTIATLLEKKNIDLLLISNSRLGYLLLPFLRSRLPILPCVDFIHLEEPYWKNGGFARLAVEYQELLTLNIVTSHHLKEWMTERGGNAQQIEVCYINVDPNIWNPELFDQTRLRHTLHIPPGLPVLIFAGRLVEQKRPDIFLEVIRRLIQEENQKVFCLIVGDGPFYLQLRTQIGLYNLQKYVRMVGAITTEQMQELYAVADIIFLPSAHEGISLAIYEAMAMQTVPVSADVGGQSELVTPECGFLIPHGDTEIDDYLDVLKKLLQSPKLRQELAKTGRQRIIKHFHIEQMANRMTSLVEQAFKHSTTNPAPLISIQQGNTCANRAIEYITLETDYQKIKDRLHNLLNFDLPEVLAQTVPTRHLLNGLWLKFLFKMKLKKPRNDLFSDNRE